MCFLSHNSPHGVHDRDDEAHTGLTALNAYIKRAAPLLLLHGHQHQERETYMGSTRVISVFGWKVHRALKEHRSRRYTARLKHGILINSPSTIFFTSERRIPETGRHRHIPI